MIAIRFDVNDEKNRASFFGRGLGEAVDRPTPRGFRNPELGEIPPAYQCASLQDARTWFNQELVRFSGHYQSHPKAVHVHPIFGTLGKEEWERSHFKHCCHHLLQFGLIGEPESPGR